MILPISISLLSSKSFFKIVKNLFSLYMFIYVIYVIYVYICLFCNIFSIKISLLLFEFIYIFVISAGV